MDQFVGKPLLLAFYSPDPAGEHVRVLRDLAEHYAALSELGVQVAAIGSQAPAEQIELVRSHALPFPLLSDADGKVAASFDAVARTGLRKALLIAPGVQIVAEYMPPLDGSLAQRALADARAAFQREPGRLVVQQAPVLLIRNVIPPEMCQRLMHAWEVEGHQEYGSVKEVDGQAVRAVDHGHKKRSDYYVRNNPELNQLVVNYIGRRVVPEINWSFFYRVTKFEDFRVGCYDAGAGGYFRAHRDNTTPATRQRKFAMSLLLNDDYEGGTLRFPEHGPHAYRPEAGAAVIFSCNLLHEATDVTAGRRFVLLSFFW
jgi:predicted 2-oxoglutarate/Fe(II)-dependent dioxygenase YbiX